MVLFIKTLHHFKTKPFSHFEKSLGTILTKKRSQGFRKSSVTFLYDNIRNQGTELLPIYLFGGGLNFNYRKLIQNNFMKFPLHISGLWNHHDYLFWKYDRLNFLKHHYNIICNDKNIIMFIIEHWAYLINPRLQLPNKFNKNPWRGRRKGTHRKLHGFYGKLFLLQRDLITIASQNKNLVGPILNYVWKSESLTSVQKQFLLTKIMGEMPLSSWTIYSYMIKDLEVRENLLLIGSKNSNLIYKDFKAVKEYPKSDFY